MNKAYATSQFPMRRTLLSTAFASAFALTACSGGDQDQGQVTSTQKVFSGVAVDGHIARAKVFFDSNNNGTRDPWEDFAFTDDEGYYSYNPNSDTDYCASSATAEQQQYCLRTNSTLTNAVIRVDGGYDRLTGEPFLGQLSRRVNTANPADQQNLVISPISSLLSSLNDSQRENTLLAQVGLDRSSLDIDYLNASGNGEVDAHLLNTAIKVHKLVTVLSDKVDDNYGEMREQPGMPNDASGAVYESLAEYILNNNQDLNTVASNPTALISVLDASESRIRQFYDQRDLDLPADVGDSQNPGQFLRTASVASQVPQIVDRLLNVFDTAMDQGQVLGNARALEAVIIKAVNENGVDTSIDNAFNFFLDSNNDSLIESLRIALSDNQADISALANNDFTGDDFDSSQEITAAARIRDDAAAFRDLNGKKLRISELDLGFAPSNLKDIELELYFSAGDNGLSGSIVACAKYIDGASQTKLGEGNFRGEILSGYWSLLGATEIDPSSYSLLLTFDFLGANYQAIMKPAGLTTISSQQYHQIRFDYNGDFKIWHSAAGFTEQDSLPTTSADCASRLPSRVGL